MRRQHQGLLSTALLLLLGSSRACAQKDSAGGRDVIIALFSTQDVRRVNLTPLSADAWTAPCATCRRTPLRSPLALAAPVQVLAGGTLRVTDLASGVERTTAGFWHLQSRTSHDPLDINVRVPSERYVAAVLNAEADPAEPADSLQALAIVVRTYALNGPHYTAPPGRQPAGLCDSTACQALRFGPVSAAVRDAVRETAGETLWFRGRLAQVFFSQHCGGITEAGGAMSPQLAGLTYLPSHPDPYCLRRGTAAWHAEVSVPDLVKITGEQGWRIPTPLVAIGVERSRSGRALQIRFTAADKHTTLIPAAPLRLALDRALGWNLLRSDLYGLGLHNGRLIFDGRGHGHGVGLCQAGALEMARSGRSAREILAFYLPGTHVGVQPGDDGWTQTRLGLLTLRSVPSVTAAEQGALSHAWAEAAQRFPSSLPLTPTILFAPTSELFRQLTAQPGWDLASTSGSVTVLQPAAVLTSQHVSLNALLLHEFLHMRVEAESAERTPVWLREGLVEMLAGEPSAAAPHLSPEGIDRLLRVPANRGEAEAAHGAADALVTGLVRRYGFSAVRGWLAKGVPSGTV